MDRGTAREVYAHGWALTGGPLTERVKAGCATAVTLATEHADDPGILETTLILGTLEGTWAQVYDRRERLFTRRITAVTTAFHVLMAGLAITPNIRRFMGGVHASPPGDRAQVIRVLAELEADRCLHQAVDDPSAPAYVATLNAVAGALLDAEAEGTAAAVAVAALQHGLTRVDFDKVFADARAHSDIDTARGDARTLLGQIINGTASDLRDFLVRFAETGSGRVKEDDTGDDSADDEDLADEATLVAGVTAFLGDDIRAIDTLFDQAMGRAFTNGALGLLTREGATTVDFVTAGTNSCPRCLDIEAGNPWPIGQVPSPPIHPRCECTTTSTNLLPALDVSNYLLGV